MKIIIGNILAAVALLLSIGCASPGVTPPSPGSVVSAAQPVTSAPVANSTVAMSQKPVPAEMSAQSTVPTPILPQAAAPASPITRGPNEVWAIGGDGLGVFKPSSITVSVGTTVIWTNKSGSLHTVSSEGLFDTLLTPDETFRYTFTKAGTYSYSSTIETNDMSGTVIVK